MERKIIENKEFVDFVNGSQAHDELAGIERKLMDAGEAIYAVHASIVNYRSRYDEAEDMLGSDEIFFRRKAINSIVSETSNDDTMIHKFNQEEISGINAVLDELNAISDESNPSDVLIDFYLKKCPGTTLSEAQGVVKRLMDGVTRFNENLCKAGTDSCNGVDYMELVEKATEDMSPDAKYDFLVNYLVAMQLVSVGNYDLNLNVIEGFDELKGKVYVAAGEVTEDMLDELKSMISDAMNNSVLILPGQDSLENLINSLAEGNIAVENFCINSKEDLEHKMKLSLATYIAYRQGQISSLAETDVTPEYIGIGVAAGVEESKVIVQARNGEKDADSAIRIIRFIGGIALFTALCVAAVWMSLHAFTAVADALISVLGSGVIGTITSNALSFFLVGIPLTLEFGKISESLVTEADRIFDKMIQVWIPAALIWTTMKAEEFAAWISDKINTDEITVANSEDESEQSVIR